ncbi:MAG: hypothetical protein HY021_10690, partial [Burkholderiales bacterium]|nr:hypothetical protein [Burkholderiales bacterium]
MTRRTRFALIALAWLAALLLTLAGGLNWAWRSDASLSWLLAQLPNAQVAGVHGSLASGHLEIDRLTWQGDGVRVQIDKLVLNGVTVGWRARTLSAGLASAQQVEVRTLPSKTPTPEPRDLRLPVTIDVAALRVRQLRVDQAPAMHELSARVSLGQAAHRIDQLSLEVESARVSGAFQIATTGALAAKAALRAASTGARPWHAEAQATGPLSRLGLTLALQGEAVPGHPAPSASAQATLTPFAPWPLAALSLATRQLDLAALSVRLPETALDGDAQVQTSGMDQPASARLAITNSRPGRWDEARLPLQKITLNLKGEPRQRDRLRIESLLLQLADGRGPAGRATGSGRWQGEQAEVELVLDALLPARLDARAAALTVSGPIRLQLSQLGNAPRFALNAALQGRTLDGLGAPVQLQLDADGDANRVHLARALAESGTAQAAFSGDAQREGSGWRVSARAKLDRFDPLPWWRGSEGSAWRRGPHRLNGQASAAGLWRRAAPPGFDGTLAAELADSLIAGVPLAGKLQWQGSGAAGSGEAWAEAGGNRVALSGRRAVNAADDRWQWSVKAPALAALAPLGRLVAEADPAIAGWWPEAGRVDADGQLQGRWPALALQGQARIEGWRSRAAQLAQGTLEGRIDKADDAPIALHLQARELAVGGLVLDQLDAQIDGKLGAHTLRLRADSPARPPAWTEALLGGAGSGTRLEGSARGAWTRQPGGGGRWAWQGLTLTGGARQPQGQSRPWLEARELAGELALDADGTPRALHLNPGRVQLLSTALRWSDAQWQADGRMTLAAELETINVAALLKQAQPTLGWSGDLTIGGRIDIRSAARVDADIVLERLGGDLAVTDELGITQALGLTDLRLALSAHDGVWQFAQGLAGRYIGEMAGAQVLRTGADQRWPGPDANLQGVLQARVANLGVWGAWVPPGWRLAGSLTTSAEFGGRLGAPELRGAMRGSGLGVRNLLQGVNVSDGELAITLRGERAEIER